MIGHNYLCCGREVPDEVSPFHNVALCSFCYAALLWREQAAEAARQQEFVAIIRVAPWPLGWLIRLAHKFLGLPR